MKTIAEIIELCRQPGVPGGASVVLRFSNGLVGQERQTGLTKADLMALAVHAQECLERRGAAERER